MTGDPDQISKVPFDNSAADETLEKLKKIQEQSMKNLETEVPSLKQPMEPEVDGRWRQLSERKWEFRKNGIVLSTIFHKPNGKFSLFYKTPDMYKKTHQVAADTFLFDTYDEAVARFPELLRERALGWCLAIISVVT